MRMNIPSELGSSFSLQCPALEGEGKFVTQVYVGYFSSFVLVLQNYIFSVLCNQHPKLMRSTEGFRKELCVELGTTE